MKEPRITFSNIKTFRGMEGTGINAHVHINGLKCLFIYDSGDGGDLEIEKLTKSSIPNIDKRIELLNKFVDQLPKEKFEFGKTVKYYKVTLESYLNTKINDFMIAKEKAKFQKKMEKHFLTCIVFGVPDSGSYQFLNYKKPLSSLPDMFLENQIKNVQNKYCKDNVQILNTNLEKFLSN